jgi:hypothetical protein
MMSALRCRFPVYRFPALLGAVLLLGCGRGGGSLPEQADPAQAKQALRLALDAWQKGDSTDALRERTPAIHFNDPKPASGVRLLSYELPDAHEFFGQSVRLKVKALVEQKDGAQRERTLTYLIDTSPAVVIVPD